MVAAVHAPDTVEVDLRVDAGTKLKNAAVAAIDAPACRSGIPVESVTVDDKAIAEGPASLAPTSRLTLRFPFDASSDLPSTGLAYPVLLDLDLVSARGHHCVRLALERPEGSWARMVGELSLLRKERAPEDP